MKYFTSRLLGCYGASKKSIREKAEQQWHRNMEAYWKYIANILPKLKPSARKFLNKTSLHDAMIVSITIGDLRGFSKNSMWPKTSYAKLKVIHPESGDLHILQYSCLRNYRIEYHGKKNFRKPIDFVVDDWGYDEFSITKDNWLRHEILLSSNAIITLEFKDFSYKVEKFKNSYARLKKVNQIITN